MSTVQSATVLFAAMSMRHGKIFSNQSNRTLFQGSSSYRFISSTLVGEALALKAALVGASSSEIRNINMYFNSQSLVMLLNSDGVINELKSILFDIRCLMSSFSLSIHFMYVPRTANKLADTLAKSALRSLTSTVM